MAETADNVYKWTADRKATSNNEQMSPLEDRRITYRGVYPQGGYSSGNPEANKITSKLWSYDPDTVMVLSSTDGNGISNYYEYDSYRLLTKKYYVTNLGSDYEQFTYNSSHDMITSRDRNGETRDYIYQNHLVTRVDYKVDSTNYYKQYSYSNGLLTSETDSDSYVINYSYDPQGQGQLHQKTYNRDVWISEGNVQTQQQTVTWNRDIFGRLLSYTDASGHTVTYAYDSARYLMSKSEDVDANGTIQAQTENYYYDTVGNLTDVKDYTGEFTKYAYDADGNVTSVSKEDESGQFQVVKSYEYESSGKVVKVTDAEGQITEIYRNAAGWKDQVIQKAVTTDQGVQNLVTTFTYDLAGNLIAKNLPNVSGVAGTWNYTYNNKNRLISVLEPGSLSAASYSYDNNGNLVQFVDPNGNQADFTYNEINKVSLVQQQDRVDANFRYDSEGRVDEAWEGTSTPHNVYTYSPEGTLEQADLKDGQVINYGYDERGLQVFASRSDSPGETSKTFLGYNINGLLSSKSQSINSGSTTDMSFKYNELSQVIQINYPKDPTDAAFAVTYNYTDDAFHYLKNIPGYVDSVDYDGNGRVELIVFTNGTEEVISRNELGQPSGLNIIDTDEPGGAVNRFLETYLWNKRGNLASRTRTEYGQPGEPQINEAFGYDPNDRLTSVHEDTVLAYAYSYDPAGNRLIDPETQQSDYYEYDSVNRLIRQGLASVGHFEFDWTEPDGRKRGNMVTKKHYTGAQYNSTKATYYWTEDNLLRQVDREGISPVYYVYDASGDRVRRTHVADITNYMFLGLNVMYEEKPDGSADYYIHAMGRHLVRVTIDSQGTQQTHFFHADYLGSVRLVTDVTGAVIWSERYRPFGSEAEQSGSIENDYRFTGKAWDAEAELFYFNARWYDPDIGRFISEDPLWGNIGDPQSLNRFAYGRNNPFRYTDPTGMEPDEYDYEPDDNGDSEKLADLEERWADNLRNLALELVGNMNITDLEKLARMLDRAQSLDKSGKGRALDSLIDVLAGDIPFINKSPVERVRGFEDTGFKLKYKDPPNYVGRNQVRHFMGSVDAGKKLGYFFGEIGLRINEFRSGQPQSGPDIDLGLIGIDFGVRNQDIPNWSGWTRGNLGQ